MHPNGGRPTLWLERCRSLLAPSSGCVVVRADRSIGVHHVISDISSSSHSTVWMCLDEYDVDDPISIGNKFASAVSKAYGSTVFGIGVPIGHTIRQMRRFHDLFGPLTVFLSGGDRCVDAVSRIRELAECGSLVCIIVPEATSDEVVSKWRPSHVVEAERLKLSDDEGLEIAAGLMALKDAVSLLLDCGSRYLTFASQVRRLAELPPLLDPEPNGFSITGEAVEELPADLLVNALRRRGARMEAFEVSVRLLPNLSEELVDEAGPMYLGAGLARRLLRQIDELPTELVHASDGLMRWWFAALTVQNRHRSARAVVEKVLAAREAPELRALYAAAFPGPEMVAETLRALKAFESPVTLRLHGFALGQQAGNGDGLTVLMRALRMAEALGDVDQVVAAATEISNLYTRRGNYRDGAVWASWALEKYSSLGGRDVVRRLVAVSLLAYGRLLIDDRVGLSDLIDQLEVSQDLLGMPTVEGIVTTIADWHVVKGDFEAAEMWYRKNLEVLPREQYHLGALDIIPVLIALGRHDEARLIGGRARTISKTSDSVSRALGDLAFALSEIESGSEELESMLAATIAILINGADAHRVAQASFALARVRYMRGDDVGALRAIGIGEQGVRELGASGVCLLAGGWEHEERIRALGKRDTVEAHLFVLGDARLELRKGAINLTDRNAECLAILANRPDGLTLEQLALKLYGERGALGTAKALVSRLRSTIPLTSRPYRIGVAFRADYVELLSHLNHGRLQDALALYAGPLLPSSQAPEIVSLREHIDEALRLAVLGSGDPEVMLEFARKSDESDLGVLEEALLRMEPDDPKAPVLLARILQVRRDWAS